MKPATNTHRTNEYKFVRVLFPTNSDNEHFKSVSFCRARFDVFFKYAYRLIPRPSVYYGHVSKGVRRKTRTRAMRHRSRILPTTVSAGSRRNDFLRPFLSLKLISTIRYVSKHVRWFTSPFAPPKPTAVFDASRI